MIDFWSITIGLGVVLLFVLWKHVNKYKGHLESLGIPVEPSVLIFGKEKNQQILSTLFFVPLSGAVNIIFGTDVVYI